jgi:hypothetical protein
MNGLLSADRHFSRNPDGPLERLFCLAPLRRDACWRRVVELRGKYGTCLASLVEGLLVPAHDSLLVPLATTARPAAAVELASSDTDEKSF